MSRFGCPASGPMDRLAHASANAALGRPKDSTAIEISSGGLELECEAGEVTYCVTGGEFRVVHAGCSTTSWCVRTLRPGHILSIRPGRWGSWAYLAFAGELVCKQWAGRTATHSTSGFGGGCLSSGTAVAVRNSMVVEEREGPFRTPDFACSRTFTRVVLGPQTGQFEPDSITMLLRDAFTVTPAYDRMGMRLSGPTLSLKDALSLPSEPVVRGSIQVGGDGVSSVLLADHQTTGGYPKIATILSSDIDGLTQLRPRDNLRFVAVDADEAVRLVRSHARACSKYLEEFETPRGSLEQRLMRESLISGVVLAEP